VKDTNKTRAQLLSELADVRRHVAELEAAEVQRKQVEVALRESEERYRTLVENQGEGIGIVDLEERFRFANPAAEELFGVPPGGLIGRSLEEFTTPEQFALVRTQKEKRSAGERSSYELEITRLDRVKRSIRVTATPQFDHAKRFTGAFGIFYDVTERKQAEEELYRSRQMLQLVLDNIPQRVFWKDRNFAYLGCNKAFAQDAGFDDSNALIGKNDFELSWIDTAELYRADDRLVMESDSPKLNYEEPQSRPDGSQLWLRTNKVPLHDREGNVIGVLGTYEDITEHKQAREALARRAREMTALYETSLEINSQLDVSALLHAIVRRAAELLEARMGALYLMRPDNETLELVVSHNLPGNYVGMTLLLGQGLSGRIAQTRQPMMVADYGRWEGRAAIYADSPFRRVLGVPLKRQGQVIGVINITDDKRTGLFDEQEVRLVSLFADQAAIAVENARLYEAAQGELAERKQVEEALRYRIELEKLVSNISTNFINLPSNEIDSAIVKSLRAIGSFVGADRSYVFQLSEDRATVTNTHEWCAEGVEPQISKLQKVPASLIPWSLRKLGQFEAVHVSRVDDLSTEAGADKSLFQAQGIISLVLVPLVYSNSLVGFMGLDSVRAERAWADEDTALLQTAGEVFINALERKRADEALSRHATELQARNEELDAFAHTVAHDLKNPLGLLTGFAEVLETNYTLLTDEERQRSCRSIAQSARKMGNIIEELLLLAGVRKMDVDIRPLDMRSIVDEAKQRLGDMIEKRQAEVILPDRWPRASGYAPWIEEVWVNYLSNAIQYGGHPPRVELGAETLPNGIVRFWVRDNGSGLTLEDQTRLFTPFTRLDQARVKGYGLGLSIVRRIIGKLGGQVGVESDGVPGHGSVFYFTLPGSK